MTSHREVTTPSDTFTNGSPTTSTVSPRVEVVYSDNLAYLHIEDNGAGSRDTTMNKEVNHQDDTKKVSNSMPLSIHDLLMSDSLQDNKLGLQQLTNLIDDAENQQDPTVSVDPYKTRDLSSSNRTIANHLLYGDNMGERSPAVAQVQSLLMKFIGGRFEEEQKKEGDVDDDGQSQCSDLTEDDFREDDSLSQDEVFTSNGKHEGALHATVLDVISLWLYSNCIKNNGPQHDVRVEDSFWKMVFNVLKNTIERDCMDKVIFDSSLRCLGMLVQLGDPTLDSLLRLELLPSLVAIREAGGLTDSSVARAEAKGILDLVL